jgi:transcriptional regulator with XRE-family HTH domain
LDREESETGNDDDGSRQELGKALTVLRIISGLYQEDLEKTTGVRSSSISDYERGKMIPSLKTLQRLLGGMGLTLSAMEEAQALIEYVRRERLGASPLSGGTGGNEIKAPVSLWIAGNRPALRRDIERVASAAGKDLAQLFRLTLLLLSESPVGDSGLRSGDDST